MASGKDPKNDKGEGEQKPPPETPIRDLKPINESDSEQNAARAADGKNKENDCCKQQTSADASKDSDKKPFWKRPSLTDWIMTTATAVIAGATVYNAVYVGGQLAAMKLGGKDTHALAEASETSVRAWIAPIKFAADLTDPSNPLKIIISYQNVGREPAEFVNTAKVS